MKIIYSNNDKQVHMVLPPAEAHAVLTAVGSCSLFRLLKMGLPYVEAREIHKNCCILYSKMRETIEEARRSSPLVDHVSKVAGESTEEVELRLAAEAAAGRITR